MKPLRFFKNVGILLMIALLHACVKSELETPEQELLNRDQLNELIDSEMRGGDLFDWRDQSAQVVWSAALQSDSVLAVGYTVNGRKDLRDDIHLIDTQQDNWQASRREILDKILYMESGKGKRSGLTDEDILMPHMIDEWPTLFVVVRELETVQMLLGLEDVRYVEPTGYYPETPFSKNSSGCGNNPNYNINGSDYSSITPNVKQPWNFPLHQINDAWSKSSGSGETVGIIDSGASFDQDNLNGNFNSGTSTGRTVEKLSTKWSGSWWWASLDSPDDACGHGTSMAGTATAPRGGDGNAVGVAYNADLLSIRAVEDVVISSSNEKRGVRDALKLIANRNDVRIASMSIGTPFYSSTVNDGVNYAYNRGVLILAAAGTSLSWTTWYGVVFPASSNRTVAVTGVDESNSTCEFCHDGSKVDFTITMQRTNNEDRTSIALASYADQPSYVGGSSVATATTAGIAAMVWSEHPNDSRSGVIQRLKQASDNYPVRDSDHGWGRINAFQAVQ